MKHLQIGISSADQRYVDEPVYRTVSDVNPTAAAVNAAFFDSETPGPQLERIEELDHYNRFRIERFTVDKDGKVVPCATSPSR